MRARLLALIVPVFKLSVLELVVQVLGFLFVIVKFRYFGPAIMGLIAYFGALGEIPSAFYSHFNKGLVRFVPVASPPRKVEILLTSFLCQAGLTGLVLAAAGVLALASLASPPLAFWRSHAVVEGKDLGFAAGFTAALVVLAMVQSSLSAMAVGIHRVVSVQVMKVLQVLVQVAAMGAVMLWVEDRTLGLSAYYWILVAIYSLSVAYLGVLVSRETSLRNHLGLLRPAALRASFASVYREHFRVYTLPQQYTALLGYVKENLAVLLLGQTGQLADAGVYNLANKVYTLPRRFIPSIVSMLMPRMVVKAEKDREGFRRKFDDFAWAQFGAYAALGTALYAGLPILRRIFAIEEGPELSLVFYLFSANLVLNSLALINLNIIELGKDLRFYSLSVSVRIAVVAIMTSVLVPRYGTPGATAALVLSTMVLTCLLAWDTRRTDLWDWRQNYRQGLAWLVLLAAWGALALFFPAQYGWGAG